MILTEELLLHRFLLWQIY